MRMTTNFLACRKAEDDKLWSKHNRSQSYFILATCVEETFMVMNTSLILESRYVNTRPKCVMTARPVR